MPDPVPFPSDMSLVIADAGPTDLADWLELRSYLFSDMSEEQQRAELEGFLELEGYHGWIARIDGQAVGFAEASLRPYANGCEGHPVPFLEGIWVNPPHRSRGIGRALIAAIERWALDQGFRELGSDVDIANLISQAAHRSWGFEERETVVYYRRRLGSG